MTTPTTPTKLDPITEWQQHWPFKRASPELTQRVQRALAQRQHEAERHALAKIEDAPF